MPTKKGILQTAEMGWYGTYTFSAFSALLWHKQKHVQLYICTHLRKEKREERRLLGNGISIRSGSQHFKLRIRVRDFVMLHRGRWFVNTAITTLVQQKRIVTTFILFYYTSSSCIRE